MPPVVKVIVSMFIWGSIGIFVKHIQLPSMEIAFMRAVIAALFLALAAPKFRSRGDLANVRKNIALLVISGAALGLNWILLFTAYDYTTVSNATLSYYFAPVFIILLSPLVLKERFTRAKLFAVIGATIGLFLILKGQSSGGAASYNHIKGIAFGLMAACLYASVVLLNKYIKGISAYTMTLIQISISALVLLPFILYRHSLSISGGSMIILIIIIGIIHTGLAYLMYFTGIKDIEAQRAAVLSYIDPVTSVILGTLLLAEPLSILEVLGGILILGSTYLGERVGK